MPAPRLLITDVDRTLLTHDHVLPQRVADALDAARAAGMVVVLATARSPAGVRPYAERLGLGGLAICFNGGWIGDVTTGIAWRETRIPRAGALEVVTAAHKACLRPMWFTGGGIHALSADPLIAREADITGETVQVQDGIGGLPGEPGKIMCVAATPAEHEGFEAMRLRFAEHLSVLRSHQRLLEIGPRGVTKRAAAEAVAAYLGIDRADCAAAGDAENDLEMLAWAHRAVTVANAVPAARQLAGFVAPSCDTGGLADAIAWLTAPG
jgi:Cof subfamily protein (haloacid dehalogenase superfamily)